MKSIVAAGDSITYILTVANFGNQDMDTVTVTDAIPAGLNYVSSDPAGSHALGVVTWTASPWPPES